MCKILGTFITVDGATGVMLVGNDVVTLAVVILDCYKACATARKSSCWNCIGFMEKQLGIDFYKRELAVARFYWCNLKYEITILLIQLHCIRILIPLEVLHVTSVLQADATIGGNAFASRRLNVLYRWSYVYMIELHTLK